MQTEFVIYRIGKPEEEIGMALAIVQPTAQRLISYLLAPQPREAYIYLAGAPVSQYAPKRKESCPLRLGSVVDCRLHWICADQANRKPRPAQAKRRENRGGSSQAGGPKPAGDRAQSLECA